jgi:hypothetical protein
MTTLWKKYHILQKESDLFTLLLMTLQGRNAEGAIIADIPSA